MRCDYPYKTTLAFRYTRYDRFILTVTVPFVSYFVHYHLDYAHNQRSERWSRSADAAGG